jgi:hypothetical protein
MKCCANPFLLTSFIHLSESPHQDYEYIAAGATIVPSHEEALKQDVVFKVINWQLAVAVAEVPPHIFFHLFCEAFCSIDINLLAMHLGHKFRVWSSGFTPTSKCHNQVFIIRELCGSEALMLGVLSSATSDRFALLHWRKFPICAHLVVTSSATFSQPRILSYWRLYLRRGPQ